MHYLSLSLSLSNSSLRIKDLDYVTLQDVTYCATVSYKKTPIRDWRVCLLMFDFEFEKSKK